ncbi:MAG: hypothetical protein LBF72_03585 [Holosporales bacterium]|nr:hypothetical protein [Holosporales bacterium]
MCNVEELSEFDHSSATFFNTASGAEIIVQSFDEFVTKVMDKYKNTICFHLPFELGCKLKVGQSVDMSNLFSKCIESKVIGHISNITLIANGTQRHAHIELYFWPEWLIDWERSFMKYKDFPVTVTELSKLSGFNKQEKKSGDPQCNLIKDISIQNDASSQSLLLAEENCAEILDKHPTKITILLKDLTTKKVLTHDVLLELPIH